MSSSGSTWRYSFPLFMSESPKFPRLTEITVSVLMASAMEQIPRSTERISSFNNDQLSLTNPRDALHHSERATNKSGGRSV